MCIGVPGQVLAVGDYIHHLAQVEVCVIKRDVIIALICEGKPA
ncbi:HypC/HybG/HupF family hydrogenase formation chaperone, partial [Salmonella enterica subsp. enterica serovar Infantis]